MGAASALSSDYGFVGLRHGLSRRGPRVRARRVDEFVSRSEPAPRHSRRSFSGARRQRGGNAARAKIAVGKQPQRFVSTAAENRTRVDAVSLRRYGTRVPGRVQQCAAGGAQPSAGGARGSGTTCVAEYEHAVFARQRPALRGTADGTLPSAAACVLLREFGERGE